MTILLIVAGATIALCAIAAVGHLSRIADAQAAIARAVELRDRQDAIERANLATRQ